MQRDAETETERQRDTNTEIYTETVSDILK